MPDARTASLSLQTLGLTGVMCLSALVLAPKSVCADVSVQQSTDKKLGKAVFTVSNGMYRVEWVQVKGATPTIARAWAGDDVPVGRLFQVSWGQVMGGTFSVVERGPVRAVLSGQFRVKQAGSSAIDIVRIRAEHWDNDPRIVVACDFELGKKRTSWVLCSNYLRIGGEANHPDRWIASGKPDGGLLDPLTSAPVPDGKRWAFFDFMTPWGEVYRPEPQDKSAGVGAFTDAHGMRGEHYWHPNSKVYSQHRWLWSYFRMNSAFKGKYRQAFTLVVHPGTEEPETGQPWTGYCYDRFAADGSLKGIWMSPLRWQKRKLLGKRLPWSQVEVIEDLGLPRSNVPLVIPLPADLPDRDHAQVWLGGLPDPNDVGASALPTQWNCSRSSLLCQLPYLGANELVSAHVLIPAEGAEAPVTQKAASPKAVDRIRWRIDLPVHRLNYLRGEVLPLKLTAAPDGESLIGAVGRIAVIADPHPSEAKWAAPVIGTDPAMSFPLTIGPLTEGTGAELRLPTRDLAAGEYRLLAEVQEPVRKRPTQKVLRIRVCPPTSCNFEIGGWGGDYKSQSEHNLSTCILTEPSAMDDCLRLGMKFSLRTSVYYNTKLAVDYPEVRMKRPDGTDMPLHVNRKKPTPCLLNPRQRAMAVEKQRAQMNVALPYPAMSKFMYTSDDVQLYEWCCYCQTCKGRFKKLTGLEAPQPPTAEQARAKQGVIAEDDPWLKWNLFRCGEVYAGYNRELVKATQELIPEVKLGSVSGPMQRPILYPSQGLNPADDQGAWTLLSYYYYPHYLFPLASNIFYTELARIGGRGKEAATLGDCYGPTVEQAHVRNSFYSLLAAGNHTIQFFTWRDRHPEAAEEIRKLGRITRRLGNLFLALKRSPKPIGLLCPFTTAIHENEWAHGSAQGSFLNLLSAHLEVEPVGEEEVISGRASQYKAVIVADVRWLRRSCVDKLVDYIQAGGTVLVDKTTAVEIPGAKRVGFSFPGTVHYAEDSMDPLSFTYAHPDLVTKVKNAVTPLASPFAEADSMQLHLRRFVGAGATYLWVVNAYSREEFNYLFRNCQFWRGPDKWIGRQKLIEYLRSRGAYGGRFSANVRIPAGDWAVYDVLAGKRLATRAEKAGLAFTVDIERFGGTLIALYPSPVAKVKVNCGRVERGQPVQWKVSILGSDREPVDALQAVDVQVTDPKGSPSEYSGHYVARSGQLHLTPTIAVNDLRGRWKVEVKELASGVAGKAYFRVR